MMEIIYQNKINLSDVLDLEPEKVLKQVKDFFGVPSPPLY